MMKMAKNNTYIDYCTNGDKKNITTDFYKPQKTQAIITQDTKLTIKKKQRRKSKQNPILTTQHNTTHLP